MKTKPFINMFGTEVQLTREEFVNRWLEKANGFAGLFFDHGEYSQLVDFKNEVQRMAGIEWDKSK